MRTLDHAVNGLEELRLAGPGPGQEVFSIVLTCLQLSVVIVAAVEKSSGNRLSKLQSVGTLKMLKDRLQFFACRFYRCKLNRNFNCLRTRGIQVEQVLRGVALVCVFPEYIANGSLGLWG